MCGIAGAVGFDTGAVNGMLDALECRGPDGRGGANGRDPAPWALGHVRLSIVDLDSRSGQPFISDDERWVLTFNGEIYNYIELRRELEDKGHRFRTTSDTEVLLHWILEYGEQRLDELDGMFAFCLADRETGQWLLVRDRIGEKPLYYTLTSDGRFAFSSEIGPLSVLDGVDTSLDQEALDDYLRFLYTAAPRTLYRGIRELPPGHLMRIDVADPRARAEPYWRLEEAVVPFEGSRDEAVRAFREAFESSVARRLRSDVPVGVYLSAGLDSNAIAAAARFVRPHGQMSAFTIRYLQTERGVSGGEHTLACRAAEAYGASCEEVPFSPGTDVTELARMAVSVFGQPFGNITAVASLSMAEVVSRTHKVCLIGDGGDEILVGYPRHKALALHARLSQAPALVRSLFHATARALPERGALAAGVRRARQFSHALKLTPDEAYVDWLSYVDGPGLESARGRTEPTAFTRQLLSLYQRNAKRPLLASALVDLASFVPYNLLQSADRTSMTHGLELRSPFLSPDLVSLTLGIPDAYRVDPRRPKPLLQDAMGDLLPPFIRNRPKRAFQPPVKELLRSSSPHLRSYMLGRGAKLPGVVRKEWLAEQLDAFGSGALDNTALVWGMTTLEAWLRQPIGARAMHSSVSVG